MSDNIWRFTGVLAFVLTPIIICWLAAGPRRKEWADIISGNDGRLSLSRLQAVAWSLVIFGSYAAAMIIHPPIRSATTAEIKAIDDALPTAETALKTAQQAFDEANISLASKRLDAEAAGKILKDIAPSSGNATPQQKKEVEDRTANKKKADDDLKTADAKVRAAEADLKLKTKRRNDARSGWRGVHWVTLPAEVLALAGISLASGAFASIIAISKNEQAPPTVTQITAAATPAALPAVVLPTAAPTNSPYWLQITGQNLGAGGSVRIDGIALKPLLWTPTLIATEIAPGTYNSLTVDTPGGKVVYQVTGVFANGLILGQQQKQREWGDLFRDDTNPNILSVTKFQMFGWTIVAIAIYMGLFFEALWTLRIDSLPLIDSTVVLLTGVSQASYLMGKATAQPSKP